MDAAELFGGEQVSRARRYHAPLYLAALAGIALELLVLTLCVFTSLGGRLFTLLGARPWWEQAVGLTALIELLTAAAALPLTVWAGFAHERSWGFSTQSLRGFAGDRVKGLGLGVLLSCAGMLGLVATARALPSLWPLVGGAGAAGVVLALGFIAPLLVEPLFNRFAPLDDPELASGLGALAERAGLPLSEVLVADASRRTHKSNAYVSGLGATRRLVLYDTLLDHASRAELELVLAHELGHRREGHLRKGVALGMAASAGFVVIDWALLRSAELRGVIGAPAGAGSPRVVPFVLLLAASLGVLVRPFGAALSRRWERAADRFSLELTGDLSAFESTHHALALSNLADLDPSRAAYLAFFSHPTPAERITAARRDAEALGAAPR